MAKQRDQQRFHPDVTPANRGKVSKTTQRKMAQAESAVSTLPKREARRAQTAKMGAEDTASLLNTINAQPVKSIERELSNVLPPEMLYWVDEQESADD